MGLDVRTPIGLLLAIVGGLLVGWGLVSDPALYRRSFGVNVNLWWGAVLLGLGLAFLAATRRRRG